MARCLIHRGCDLQVATCWQSEQRAGGMGGTAVGAETRAPRCLLHTQVAAVGYCAHTLRLRLLPTHNCCGCGGHTTTAGLPFCCLCRRRLRR